jgi:AraC family transcriptional regulator
MTIMVGRTMKQRPRAKRVTTRQRHKPIEEEHHVQGGACSTQAFQPFAAGLQSDTLGSCLLSLGVTASEGPQGTALDSSSPTRLQQFVYMANSLVELLETAKRELKGNHETAKASLVTASHILQAEIERCSGANGFTRGGLAVWQILRVRAYIDSNLHRAIHIRDLSAVARRSPAHFSRKFKLAVGASPHAYVVRRRLERACHLMMTSAASLSEIALSVGFSDQAHLCRLFRQAFGQSPASWRRDFENRRG